MNESEKREVEEDFWKFMRDSIWYCARNVTRSASAAERRNSGISLESLSEGSLRDYIAVENSHELGEEIEMIIRNIRFAIKSDGFGDVFDNLTEREKEALILFVGFGYDFDSIGKLLGITPERARAYKYNGLKKARAKKNGRRKNHN